MPGVVEGFAQLLADARGLSATLRAEIEGDRITLAQARAIVHACREAEAWLKGCRDLVDA